MTKFGHYAAIIIAAVVVIAIISGTIAVNNASQQEQRDHDIEQLNEQLTTKIINSGKETATLNALYHGELMYLTSNNTKTLQYNIAKLDSLIDAHNQLVQAIENATGKPQIVNNIHNTYCKIIEPTPECKHHK